MDKRIEQLPLYIIGEAGSEFIDCFFVTTKKKRLYSFPRSSPEIITQSDMVTCKYCLSHNVISSPTCVRCGAPLGEIE